MKLGELLVQHQDHIFTTQVFRGIQEATRPWELHHPIFIREFDIVEGEDVLLIEARYGVKLDHIYFHRMPIPREIVEPEEMAVILVNSFRDGFRRWRVEPEANIHLGEE